MIKNLVLLILIFFSNLSLGQNIASGFSDVGYNELELKEYENDKDAEAVVLFDMGETKFVEVDGSFELVFERKTRIKIFTDSGTEWGDVKIPLYRSNGIIEEFYDIEAYSYNIEDGRVRKSTLDDSEIYDEKVNDRWVLKRFAIPNVKAGTVIEYRYKVSTHYKFNLKDWEFQWKIPVIYSQYKVHMIPFYEYSWILQGRDKFDYFNNYEQGGLPRRFGTEEFHDQVYNFSMSEIPAFESENFITSKDDYLIKLDFQLSKIHHLNGTTDEILTTWTGLNEEYYTDKDFGKFTKKAESLTEKLLHHSLLETSNQNQLFNNVVEYVKTNYSWNNINSKIASKSVKKLIDDKMGNSAEINLLTIGLLNGVGIEAKPVLISTRKNGKIKSDYPFSHFFNYVIIMAKVNGKIVLSDATNELVLNNRIPLRCINDKGLIIQKDAPQWVSLESTIPSKTFTNVRIKLDEFDTLHSNVSFRASEYDASILRNRFKDDVEKVKEYYGSTAYEIDESSISIQNYKDKNKPYNVQYSQTSNVEVIGNKYVISPFLNKVYSENPLKEKTRNYPIDLIYPSVNYYSSVIEIPEGFEIEHLPEPDQLSNPFFDLNYSSKSVGNSIKTTLTFYFKQSVYSAKDYLHIKSFFEKIVKKSNEQVVLIKTM